MKRLLTILLLLSALGSRVAAADALPVLPYPQFAETGKGSLVYSTAVEFASTGLSADAFKRLSTHWELFASASSTGKALPAKVSLVLLGKDKAKDAQVQKAIGARLRQIGKEGYVLIFNGTERLIAAYTETGLFYALQSLKQLTRGGFDKELLIADWPAFETRAIFDDISRGPISTVEYIKEQIARLAEVKVNYLSFYIEHVVQPLSHPDFAPTNGKLTIAQLKELSAYAEQFHIKLIGSFQSFGHFEKILSLPQYTSMGETNTLISPLDPKAKQFLADVIGELCDAFSAPWFNVNCDETFDLTKGRSKLYIDSVGAARFYADHLKFLYDVVKKHGKKMMMWGDVALQHPEVIDMLPRDVVYLTWEYGDQPNYHQWINTFAARKRPFMVCPGILNSYRMFPDVVMAKGNIAGFLKAGKLQGASGAYTTIWDDGMAYLFAGVWYGVYAAAEKSWNLADAPNASFDDRYELAAYGTRNGNYVKALLKLMELRSLPLTYNLNDLLWNQAIVPEKGQPLLLNNSAVAAAQRILAATSAFATQAHPLRNSNDLMALLLATRQYKLMMDTRTGLVLAAHFYRQADSLSASDVTGRTALLKKAAGIVDSLTQDYTLLKTDYTKAWHNENQDYWLDVVSKPYENKTTDLSQLSTSLQQAISLTLRGSPLQPVDSVRLNITETPFSYFSYWMLAGPFVTGNNTAAGNIAGNTTDIGNAAGIVVPSFLYADEAAYNKPPSPGDFTTWQGKRFRWQKFASPSGGLINLYDRFGKDAGATVYAYCQIKMEQAMPTAAFINAPAGTVVFCNSEAVRLATVEGYGTSSTSVENSPSRRSLAVTVHTMTLPLKAGVNHLLLKIPNSNNTVAASWQFMFRLSPDLEVINHKHKYQTNSKNKVYDAE